MKIMVARKRADCGELVEDPVGCTSARGSAFGCTVSVRPKEYGGGVSEMRGGLLYGAQLRVCECLCSYNGVLKCFYY